MGEKRSNKLFKTSSGGKKRSVRKGLSEAFFGRRSEEDYDSASVSSKQPSIVVHPVDKKQKTQTLDMGIFGHLKKDHQSDRSSKAANEGTRGTTSGPSAIAKGLPIPRIVRPSNERSMSVHSLTTSSASESTIAQSEQDSSNGFLKKAKTALTKSPSTTMIAQRPGGSNVVVVAINTGRAKLEGELKASKEEWLAAGVSSESFLGFIAHERLRRMPPKGSRWDKILKWAEDFAQKLSLFEVADESFIVSSKAAVEIIFACLQLLLLLGPAQGEALERAFGLLDAYGATLDLYKRNVSLLISISEARRYLGLGLADAVGLMVDLTILYRESARSMTATSITLDLNTAFGGQMDSFVDHKNRIAELMWTWQLNKSSEIDMSDNHVTIAAIRQWLLPQDRTLQAARTSNYARAEFTCEWFDRPLLDFVRSKDNVLSVTAEAGAGKSVLFGWILERLRRPVGSREYQCVHASIDSQVPALASQTALVKSLLLQLLDQNVGNVGLFRCLANVTALSDSTTNDYDAEDALWYTLETALRDLDDIVLVVDGLDALEGSEALKLQVFEHLHDIGTKNPEVAVIIISRPFSQPWPKPARQLAITPERTMGDVKHMVRASLTARRIGTRAEIDDIATQVAQRSKGSLTWADLSLQYLGQSKIITDVLAAVKELPNTTREILEKGINSITLKGDTRLILSWLLVSDRPFTVSEIQANLELDLQNGSHCPRSTNIIEDIRKACGSLIVIQDKTVRFRNETIRQHLLEISKKGTPEAGLLPPVEAHKDLATRLLLYVKVCVTRNTEPSLSEISPIEVDTLFRAHPMLEYATRNWLSHLQRSSLFSGGQLQAPLAAQLKGVFPSSTLLTHLERTCWEKQAPISKANRQYLLALNIRKQTLGDSAQCVLQGYVNVAQSFKKLAAPAEASKYFYQAAKTSHAVAGRSNDLAVACATACVECSADIKATKRDDSVNQREEMLKYVVETEKQRHGAHSALASKYSHQLAQLYADVAENDKAEAVYREVYASTVAQKGEFSQEALATAGQLKTVLHKEARMEDVVQYTHPVFEAAERDLEIFDVRRVDITLQMADTYEKKNDLIGAEELYISLWRGLTEYCRASHAGVSEAALSEAHERKIQVSIAYARFLRRHGREAEAQNILHGVWIDYQHRENKSEALVGRLQEVGEELKSMGILETAIAVFKSVWGYFKGSGKQTSPAAVKTGMSLMGAVHDKSEKKKEIKRAIVRTSVEEEDSDDEEDEEADAIMEEMVKTAVAAPVTAPAQSTAMQTKDKDVSSIETCETLVNFYINKKRWNDAIQVSTQMLKHIWPGMGIKLGLPKNQRAEAIQFARRLALCYREAGQTQQAEKTYAVIFQSAVYSGHRMTDELVVESSTELIALYTRTQQYAKVLEVYQQLVEGYRTTLGARNPLTIKTMYAMGDLCVQYRLKGADKYYLEVVNADKKTAAAADGAISKESIRAALALSKIYYEQKRWIAARGIYTTLWDTFTKRAKEYCDVLPAQVVEAIYKRYTIVLQTHLGVDMEIIGKIALEYRDTCTNAYGADAPITASANLALAEVWHKSSDAKQQIEAVKICEEVVSKAEKQFADGTATSMAHVSLLASAKRRLASLYASQTQTNSSKAAGSAASQKAETLWREQLDINKKEHGIAHKVTLGSLASLVSVWAKSGKPELQTQAQQQLQVTVVEVIASGPSTDSTKLHESAVSLAQTYLGCNYSAQAWALLKSLRFQIVAKGKVDASAEKASVKLPDNVDSRSMVFLAAFEETLRSSQLVDRSSEKAVKVTFSDIMTDMVTEGILYDRYNLSMSSKDLPKEQKLFDGARLYSFLRTNDREQHAEQILAVEEPLFAMFIEMYGAGIKTESATTRALFVAILEELGLFRHRQDIVSVACTAVVTRVYNLLQAGSFLQATELAAALDQFLAAQKGFKPATIPFTFKLSLYLAGLGTNKSSDLALQARMLDLSKRILRETLVACKSSSIDLVQLQASELNSLVRIMGEQRNYEDLEWLLRQLWNSRSVQTSWSASTVIAVGRRLVQVLMVRGKREGATALAESIAYNLRRTWGLLDAATIDINNLLSTLYVADGRYPEAFDVHEEILRALLDLDKDNLPEGVDDEQAASIALQQLQLFRVVYARGAGWPDFDTGELPELVLDVVREFSDIAPEAYAAFGDGNSATWSTTAPPASDTTGLFVSPISWEFGTHYDQGDAAAPRKPAYMLRSLQLSRQRSFTNLSEAKKIRDDLSNGKIASNNNNLLTAVH